ncbi:alpha/beta hydrolase [Paenibacillus sp. GCM10027626]|uniref:alpha/beta hydrolase n=1 Tax=Paenibacillus sp. GCM10027626 TaxID=3273411 RepID=UPI0036437955
MKTTLIYKRTKQGAIYADVYNHGQGTPVLLYFHGGGLIFGERSWLPQEQIEYFTTAGYSIISFDYRLAPETKLEQIVEDLQDAMEWVRATAIPAFQFNSDKIAVIGSSAGAYLSLLAGTMEFRPSAIVSLYGYGDILGDWINSPSEAYLNRPIVGESEAEKSIGATEISKGSWSRFNYYLYCRQQGNWVAKVTGLDTARDKDLLLKFCPITNINEQFPPTLLLHGDQDTDVPFEQSVIFHDKLRQTGVYSKMLTIKDGEHVFDQDFEDAQVKNAFKEILLFLREQLNN